ncbi:MAG: glycosyltransferase [Bacilli bacterium]|nr:glycosyltransferase [Bacilli bacterium]
MKERVIVSLTSFPGRINIVWKTIVTLLNQTYKPNKIILWLSENQFESKESLPKKLRILEDYGLEIRMVPEDFKSHKKYLYAFQEFPDDYVLLVDDDILYPSDTIEALMKNISPNKVHCSYGSIIKYDENGKPANYENWQSVLHIYSGPDFFFGSGGGTLLMPSNLYSEVVDIEKAMELCPYADDIWLNTMCRLSEVKIEKVRTGLIFPSINNDKETLYRKNIGENQNNAQLKKIISKYPTLFQKKIKS